MTNTMKEVVKIEAFGRDASFVANIILTQHRNPFTKLRTVSYLLLAGREVRIAQFDIDTLLVDGNKIPWNALNNLNDALDIVNPRLEAK